MASRHLGFPDYDLNFLAFPRSHIAANGFSIHLHVWKFTKVDDSCYNKGGIKGQQAPGLPPP